MVLYEQQLKTQDAVQKEHWKRAWESYRQQETGEHDSTEGVIKKLIENGMLSGQRILDIGGGAGRYAIPFSKYAQDVTVTDISPRALAYARRYAERKGCQNIQYVVLDWDKINISTLGWDRYFDFVFASMCPAVRSRKGIDNMSAVSKGWCQINQLIYMEDTIFEKVKMQFPVQPGYDPHNDRAALQAFFNILWEQQFDPEVTYLHQSGCQSVSVDEVIPYYLRRLQENVSEQELRQFLTGYSEEGHLSVHQNTILSMIRWKVS
ncbi:class I SAM-dependent methyltransferase [Megasphaera paucivorans]|uniref:Methyltransferase domain-containing protein n=1 Tax=Megasphaera paucivorans TaxID=349095 RepID=A0A1G9XPZ3_9FIRM|nr:class I SAM-dependent methyltransferase [Megasphaera paucivorans]SDM98899.1 Methyltransferase domain-containing protein [Megasphaera paucivorans]